MDIEKIGQFIAALRKSKGLTQQEVADRLGVTDKTVSKWECGNGLPDITAIPAIAELFEVTADEILRGERIPEEKRTEKNEKKTEEQAEYHTANICKNVNMRLTFICIFMTINFLSNLYSMNTHGGTMLGNCLCLISCLCSVYPWVHSSIEIKDAMRSSIVRQYQTNIDRINALMRFCRITLLFSLYTLLLWVLAFLGGAYPIIVTWNQLIHHGLAFSIAVIGLFVYMKFNKVKL